MLNRTKQVLIVLVDWKPFKQISLFGWIIFRGVFNALLWISVVLLHKYCFPEQVGDTCPSLVRDKNIYRWSSMWSLCLLEKSSERFSWYFCGLGTSRSCLGRVYIKYALCCIKNCADFRFTHRSPIVCEILVSHYFAILFISIHPWKQSPASSPNSSKFKLRAGILAIHQLIFK